MKILDNIVTRIGKAFMSDVKEGARDSLDRVGNYLIIVAVIGALALALAIYLAVRKHT